MYLRHRAYRAFLICEDVRLLSWLYYFTHTEEEIKAEERKAIQELHGLVERLKLLQDNM